MAKTLFEQASFGDDIMSQREAAVALYDQDLAGTASSKNDGWTEVATDVNQGWEEVPNTYHDTSADKEVLDSLPDRLRFGFGEYTTEIPVNVPKGTAAFAVGAGAGMSWAYRGIKQIMGIDEEAMRADQEVMDKLYSSSEGGMAKFGNVYGSVFEPLGAVAGVNALSSAKTILGAATKVGAVGAAYGASGYVEEGGSRTTNAALGGTLGAGLGGLAKGVEKGIQSYGAREANRQLNQFEKLWAEKILQGYQQSLGKQRIKAGVPVQQMKGDMTPIIFQAAKESSQEMGKGFSLSKTAEKAGRRVRPPMTPKEAEDTVKYYKSLQKQTDIGMSADSVVGIVSTRLKNINPGIAHQVRKHDEGVLLRQHQNFQKVDPFIEIYNRVLPKAEKVSIDAALSNGNMFMVERKLEQYGGAKAVQAFQEVRKVLSNMGDEGLNHGVIKEKLDDYFPRFVKDVKGLMGNITTKERTLIDDALIKAGANKSLSALDESIVINNVLFGRRAHETVPLNSFAKKRKLKTIPPHLMKYYSSPEEALHTYIRNMVTDTEKYKFFGKAVRTKKVENLDAIDLESSVGAYINKLHKTSPLTVSEQKELRSLLQTRFGIGERSPSGITQDIKSYLNIVLLANPITALTQLGDLGVSVYKNGMFNTLRVLPEAVLNRGDIRVKDYGLLDSLAEEFASTRQAARWLHRSFTYSGFKYMDRLGKDTLIKSTYLSYSNMARNSKKAGTITREFTPAMGRQEAEKLEKDLASGELSDSVRTMLFSKLADVQPISLSEVPELYLKHPNGRIAYMLKTFMLKQVDILRQDSYNEIKKGNIGKGLANAMKYSLIMGAAGTGTSVIKNQILYGAKGETPPEVTPADLGANLLKTFGWSEYIMSTVKEGKPYEAALDAFAPPFDLVDRIVSSEDGEWVKYMPLVGKLLWTWEMGGLEKTIERDAKRQEKQLWKDLGYENVEVEE